MDTASPGTVGLPRPISDVGGARWRAIQDRKDLRCRGRRPDALAVPSNSSDSEKSYAYGNRSATGRRAAVGCWPRANPCTSPPRARHNALAGSSAFYQPLGKSGLIYPRLILSYLYYRHTWSSTIIPSPEGTKIEVFSRAANLFEEPPEAPESETITAVILELRHTIWHRGRPSSRESAGRSSRSTRAQKGAALAEGARERASSGAPNPHLRRRRAGSFRHSGTAGDPVSPARGGPVPSGPDVQGDVRLSAPPFRPCLSNLIRPRTGGRFVSSSAGVPSH